MAARRSVMDIYREQRQLDKTRPSRKRVAVFSSLSVPLIVLTVVHSVPLAVKVAGWVVYALVGFWAALTSSRLARTEGSNTTAVP